MLATGLVNSNPKGSFENQEVDDLRHPKPPRFAHYELH